MAPIDFDGWYQRERPRVVASVTAITGHPSLAVEAADEAFTRAFERWRSVSAMESPGGWVNRTALNVARRKLRRSDQERRLWRLVADVALDLWMLLQKLAPREREAMVLRHVADLSTKEVAAAMGISQGTVSSTLHSARARMTVELDKEATDV